MRIGFDLDGVLYPWHVYMYNFLVKEYLTTYNFDDFWTFGYKEYSKEFWDWAVQIKEIYNQENLSKEIVDLINELENSGNDIFYITSRPKDIINLSKKWLRDSGLKNDYKLFSTLLFNGNSEKRTLVAILGIDYFIEDKIEHANELKDITKILLIKQPYNKLIQKDFNSFNNVKEAIKFIKEN